MFGNSWNPFKKTEAAPSENNSPSLEKAPTSVESIAKSMGISLDKIKSYLDRGESLKLSPALATRAKILLPALMAMMMSLQAEDASAQTIASFTGQTVTMVNQSRQNKNTPEEQSRKNVNRQTRQVVQEGLWMLAGTATQIIGQTTKDPELRDAMRTTQAVLIATDQVDDAVYNANNKTLGTR